MSVSTINIQAQKSTAKPVRSISVTPVSQTAARLTLWAVSTFIALVALLHFIEPEYAPSWRFLSEYSNGRFGWMMKIAFFALGFSNITLFFSIRRQVSGTGGKIGLILLLLGAVGAFGGGLFNMDPLNTSPDQLTPHGNFHGISAMIGMPALPVAAMLISLHLVRQNQAWSVIRRPLLFTAHLTWISIVIMNAALFIMLGQTHGKFGPDVWSGWLNRLAVAASCMWQIIITRRIIQLSVTEHKIKEKSILV